MIPISSGVRIWIAIGHFACPVGPSFGIGVFSQPRQFVLRNFAAAPRWTILECLHWGLGGSDIRLRWHLLNGFSPESHFQPWLKRWVFVGESRKCDIFQ